MVFPKKILSFLGMSPDQISHFSNTSLIAKVYTEKSNSEAASIINVVLRHS